MKVFTWMFSSDNFIGEARPLRDEEKKRYTPEWADIIIVGTGNYIDLPNISSNDIPLKLWKSRKIWYFSGFGNQSIEISDEEWSQLIKLNAKRQAEKEEKERQDSIQHYRRIIEAAEKQKDIPTREEAARRQKIWNDINNEGGDGFVPPIINVNQYEYAKAELRKLMQEAPQ